MEILSTGEKIKRARVYKGITLKELCGEKISISKMSCIENEKIKADKECLEYISERLNIDYEYLVQDIYEQLVDNLKKIDTEVMSDEDREELIIQSLQYAKENSFYELGFKLIHTLFIIYLDKSMVEKSYTLLSDYNDIYKECRNEENDIIFQEDMAQFFTNIKEYSEGASFYCKVRELLSAQKPMDKSRYMKACLTEAVCYRKLNLITKAYDLLKENLKYVKHLPSEDIIGGYFNQLSLCSIILKNNNVDEYAQEAMKYMKDNLVYKAKSEGKLSKCYFQVGEYDKARDLMESAIRTFPRVEEKAYAEFMIDCIKTLYINKSYDKMLDIVEDTLNIAIKIDDIKLIEKSYYYKGMALQKKDSMYSAEIYMNLSTDALSKFGTREELYERYNEMGNMYHKLNETRQSLNYFILALKLEKVI